MHTFKSWRGSWLTALLLLAGSLFLTTGPAAADQTGFTAAEIAAAPTCGTFPGDQDQYLCSCQAGFSTGGLWGSGPYTGDSNICAAAQQSGVITAKGGTILAIAAPGLDKYTGATRNGITSSNWNAYDRSFKVLAVSQKTSGALPACTTIPSGVDTYQCSCAASSGQAGSVWGNSPYTYDSNICAAAIHSGVIDKSGGDVTVLRIGGLDAYRGSESNGIKTSDWGKYSSSIVFDWNR